MAKPKNTNVDHHIAIDPYSTSYSIEATDGLITSQGVTLKHYKAIPCPIGRFDKSDIRKSSHDDHGVPGIGACSNGLIYKPVGDLTCLFVTNTAKYNVVDSGMMTGTSAQLTLPRFYDDLPTKQVHVLPYDRLYYLDESITVEHWEEVQAHQSGIDKLNFPAVAVEIIVDNTGVLYYEPDFTIENGKIKWLTQNRPGVNPETRDGKVYSIRYTYRPYYYISDLVHEVRVTQIENINGQREVVRMPQTAIIKREISFENEQADDQAFVPNSPRQIKKPSEPDFGPR